MLKYLLLAIFNLPLVALGLTRSISNYRQGRTSTLRFGWWVVVWALLALLLTFASPIYNFLIDHHLTESPPLGIFGIFSITGMMLALILCMRLYARTDRLEQQLTKLHREMSIQLAERNGAAKRK